MLNALLCWAVGYLTAIVFSLMVVLPYNQKGSHKRSSAKGNYSQWASKYSVESSQQWSKSNKPTVHRKSLEQPYFFDMRSLDFIRHRKAV